MIPPWPGSSVPMSADAQITLDLRFDRDRRAWRKSLGRTGPRTAPTHQWASSRNRAQHGTHRSDGGGQPGLPTTSWGTDRGRHRMLAEQHTCRIAAHIGARRRPSASPPGGAVGSVTIRAPNAASTGSHAITSTVTDGPRR